MAQQPDSLTPQKELPKLEIPEITIVGKKAITLPFARKGEMYDVTVYEAPTADSSLLLDRVEPQLPVGSLPRYEQREMPWRISLEGSLGSFSTGQAGGFVDYKSQRWGISGKGGYGTTDGHVGNSSGNSTMLGADIHSLLVTDNDILRTLRASLGVTYQSQEYGMFGIPSPAIERRRNNILVDTRLGSLHRQGVVMDLRLGADIWKVTDAHVSSDSQVSVVSPLLLGSLATDLGIGRLITSFSFLSSSLDYQHSVESPMLFTASGSMRWGIAERVFVEVGGKYAGGSNSAGGSRTLVAPTGQIKWDIDDGRALSVWFEPQMQLTTYDQYIKSNPYLVRELEIQPERKFINFGGSFWFNRGILTLELNASFSKSSGKSMMIADSGRIRLEYVDAFQTIVQATGTLKPSSFTRIKFSGTLQPTNEDGTSTQLPMTPTVKVSGRGELDLPVSLTVWGSIDYWSKQNIDRLGNFTLGDVGLIGAGATASVFSTLAVSFEASNLLNTAYQWWNGYFAPGRKFSVEAKLRLQ
jgi:hypothetical protein